MCLLSSKSYSVQWDATQSMYRIAALVAGNQNTYLPPHVDPVHATGHTCAFYQMFTDAWKKLFCWQQPWKSSGWKWEKTNVLNKIHYNVNVSSHLYRSMRKIKAINPYPLRMLLIYCRAKRRGRARFRLPWRSRDQWRRGHTHWLRSFPSGLEQSGRGTKRGDVGVANSGVFSRFLSLLLMHPLPLGREAVTMAMTSSRAGRGGVGWVRRRKMAAETAAVAAGAPERRRRGRSGRRRWGDPEREGRARARASACVWWGRGRGSRRRGLMCSVGGTSPGPFTPAEAPPGGTSAESCLHQAGSEATEWRWRREEAKEAAAGQCRADKAAAGAAGWSSPSTYPLTSPRSGGSNTSSMRYCWKEGGRGRGPCLLACWRWKGHGGPGGNWRRANFGRQGPVTGEGVRPKGPCGQGGISREGEHWLEGDEAGEGEEIALGPKTGPLPPPPGVCRWWW